MKPALATDPRAAFPDPRHQPKAGDLREALGRAWLSLSATIEWLHTTCPGVTSAWQFSAQAGWYQTQVQRKRRLLYLVPRRGDYSLSIILGGKAVDALLSGPYAEPFDRLLSGARRYPEGTLFEFDRTSTDPGLVAALIEAKVSPETAAARRTPFPPPPHAHPRP